MDKKEHIYSRDNNKIAHNESLQRMRDKRLLILAMALPRTAADEENPLIVRRKAPHNQRIEQTPFWRSSSAAFGINIIMKNSSVIYEEENILTVKYYHPKSGDYLDYNSIIRIRDSGKNPIEMILKFKGIYPFAAPMPPEDYKIKASSITVLFLKVTKWFKKYGYILK